MKKSKTLVLGAFILCLFALATTAVSAHVFKSTTKGALKGTNILSHIFETGSGPVECKTAIASGNVTALETKDQVTAVEYSKCKAFNQEATVSTVKFDFNAEGTTTIQTEVFIKVPAFGCEVTIPAQGPLKTVTFVNTKGKIETRSAATSIKSNASGLCGEPGINGSYKGIELTEVVGGTVEWN